MRATDIQEILQRFDGVKQCGDGQYMACCPCHDDRKQSLSIGRGERGIVLKCQAGCDTRDIIARVGIKPRDLFYDKPAERPQTVAVYEYPNGVQKLRRSDKSFSWRRPDGKGGWIYNRQGVPHSLYVAGTLANRQVFVTEGEKDADNLHRFGFDAVSGADGAGPGKWRPEYTEQLRGHTVIIFLDNDAVGKAYAEETASALHGVADHVQLCDLSTVWPEIPEHGDVSDLIERFGDETACKMIVQLATQTPEWTPALSKDIFAEFGFYSVPDLTEEERRPPEFIVDGMIPVGMTFLSGAPKIRKSFLALQMAVAVATGTPFLGLATTKCDVAYLDLEGSKSRISSRSARMSTKMPSNVFITNSITERFADGLVDKLRQLHRARPSIRLIIVDTYSRARGSYRAPGANAYDADISLLEPVQRMALEENIALLFVHHDKKGAGLVLDSFERLSGTMGISGSCDCVINLVADGKRFDGKASVEYTPRDAKGGEMSLVFDERFCEWMRLAETKPDLRGNPICSWIIEHAPERQQEGKTFSYDALVRSAYGTPVDNPGEEVRRQLIPRREELFSGYGIGIQMGVKSNGARGVRVINLL